MDTPQAPAPSYRPLTERFLFRVCVCVSYIILCVVKTFRSGIVHSDWLIAGNNLGEYESLFRDFYTPQFK